MVIVLAILASFSFLIALGVFAISSSAVHEAAATLFLLNTSVLMVGAFICKAIEDLQTDQEEEATEEHA